ncbi:DMT family transporter [Geobacter argillaceus]|uniref:Drug/metabolite transporter (DMT)-like permease n=1 Tax=Geobacter argillaceus TaxID=345631 RepID=A0A562VJ62_9BACT|nr:DMT family transporter [Geobacter argillaceus]TWJ17777.1 drug/metabolite transporter (DMT)-like permease [Geobacter argillaceus]
MTVERKHLDGFGVACMIFLCMVLGLHQVAIKAAAPDISPILQIALRFGISSFLVCIVIMCGKGVFSLRDGTLLPGIIAGLAFSLEFVCVAEGLRYTTASHMSVFLYTAPIFTALTLHWFKPSERLRRHQWIGIAIAFSGVALAFTGGSFLTGISPRILWGDTLGVFAGILWAATTVLIRCSRLSEAPSTKTLLYQLVAAFIICLCYAVLSGQADRFTMTGIAWTSLLFQGVVVTFAAFLAWFSLLRRYNASQLSVFLFLSPLFGVSFGVLLLHEAIDLFFGIGAVLVLIGIALVSRPHLRGAGKENRSVVAEERPCEAND